MDSKPILLLVVLFFLFTCNTISPTDKSFEANIQLGSKGLHGYIAYDSPKSPPGYGAGVSFYTAAWQLIDQPLGNFQIGLPGTWIIPDNSDNEDIPLCPVGTYARDNWDPRGPTYRDVFQTLEGGLGYWAGNKYRYGPPKFSMNATAQCYDFEIASPGWSFFYDDQTLPTDRLGIAQLHNRILIPPDGLTFEGEPQGAFMGYAYMALPFTDAYGETTPTGDQSWTCFINTENFKGPIAYYLPETWSKVSKNYPIINGRGLDARPGIIRGGAMEINTVPHFESKDRQGVLFTKIPELKFPVDENGKALLVQDLTFYNKKALFDAILSWRQDHKSASGTFDQGGAHKPDLSTKAPRYRQTEKPISGIEEIFHTDVFASNIFGLQWSEHTKFKKGVFPQYFKEVDGVMIPVPSKEVPKETGLLEKKFPLAEKRPPYTSPEEGVWQNPGPAAGPFSVTLRDGSVVEYYWYKFIDQPVFQQFDWPEQKKNALQGFIEKIHQEWPIDRNYIAPPPIGQLVRMDEALIVNPPKGLEYGYVPIVTMQSTRQK
ncbi:MAG: hypothetical protein R2828_29245 [Saprospiraceae bacterium]